MTANIGPVRKIKLTLLHLARGVGLFAAARAMTGDGVRVLCYHGAWLGDPRYAGDCMFIGAKTFADRLDLIARLGYPIVSLSEAMDALRRGHALPPCATVITIDDGWYSTYSLMVPALEARRMPATLYCDTGNLTSGTPVFHVMARYIYTALGEPPLDEATQRLFDAATDLNSPVESREKATRAFAAEIGVDIEALIERRAFQYMTPAELRATYERGVVDVQLHTHNHSLHDMSRAAVRKEVETNATTLASILGVPRSRFRHFCYPSGRTCPAAETALESMGLASATTTRVGLAFHGNGMQDIPRFLDGENVYRVEFEAEMSGFNHLVRSAIGWMRRMKDALRARRGGPVVVSGGRVPGAP